MTTHRKSRAFALFLFLALCCGGVSTAAQELSSTPHVLVFVERTPAHMLRSDRKVFRQVVDDLFAYLQAHNVALAPDDLAEHRYSESRIPLSAVQNIARDNGADYLLYVIVDRPLMDLVKISLSCQDLKGKVLWQDEFANATALIGKRGLNSALSKMHRSLEKRLGQPGLPLALSPERSAGPAAIAY